MRPIPALLLALLIVLAIPSAAQASHSAGGGTSADGCGTLTIDNVGSMTKGRTDGVVGVADHSVGCKRLVYKQLSPAGIGEQQFNAGQMDRCVRFVQEEVAMTFKYYFDTEIDPDTVKVECPGYNGTD